MFEGYGDYSVVEPRFYKVEGVMLELVLVSCLAVSTMSFLHTTSFGQK